jgi:hypothetical protein
MDQERKDSRREQVLDKSLKEYMAAKKAKQQDGS